MFVVFFTFDLVTICGSCWWGKCLSDSNVLPGSVAFHCGCFLLSCHWKDSKEHVTLLCNVMDSQNSHEYGMILTDTLAIKCFYF